MPQRFRLRHTFWLDMRKADEADLAETIETLKQNRRFAATIRDGIQLICDLRAGQTEVLFALFPWVKESLQPAPTAADQRLQEQIKRLEDLLLAQGNVPIQRSAETPRKSLVEISTTSSKASAQVVADNFINSMRGLASGFFD